MAQAHTHSLATKILTAVSLTLFVRSDAIGQTYSLTALVRATMRAYFEKGANDKITIKDLLANKSLKKYDKSAGVFVTLSTNGRPRACWGSIYPAHSNLAQSTIYATIGALTKDYRYKPIKSSEWQALKPQVTVINAIEPLDNLQQQNPLKDGLFLRSGAKSAILLPGETTDATYQLIRCKLKAGVQPGEPYQLYKLKAEIYE